ncbi:MAG: CpsD/CapB family tyrosine-protein kinase [Phycisphaerae bacterium]|jgi:Mrp family chromosome partitioning ATPase
MNSEANENFRKVAVTLANKARENGLRAFLLTGARGGEGTTSAVLNIAHHLTHACQVDPLVVECDMQDPVLADMLRLDSSRSVSGIAAGALTPADCVQACSLGFGIIPAGHNALNKGLVPEPAPALRKILETASANDQVVLVDTPPILRSGATGAAIRVVRHIVLVVEAGRTRREMVERAKAELDRVGAEVVGVILNKHRRYIPGWVYRAFVR